jgi:hypothetical protein
MTDTTVSDAVVTPQDDGTGVADGSEGFISAGKTGVLSQSLGSDYVDTGLTFANVDTTNEQVDVAAGVAYITESGNSIQSGAQKAYDRTLPSDMVYAVILPTDVTDLALGTDTDNDVWLAVDPTSPDAVYLRHGSGLSAPSDPSLKLGTVNTSDGSTTRANDETPIDAAGGGGLVPLASATANSDATVEFTSNIDSTYGPYLFVFDNIVPQNDAVSFEVRFSSDGGASWITSNYDYSVRTLSANDSSNTNTGVGSSQLILSGNGRIDADQTAANLVGQLELYHPAGGYPLTVSALSYGHGASSSLTPEIANAAGGLEDGAAIDAVEFAFDSGNLVSGEIRLYGVALP